MDNIKFDLSYDQFIEAFNNISEDVDSDIQDLVQSIKAIIYSNKSDTDCYNEIKNLIDTSEKFTNLLLLQTTGLTKEGIIAFKHKISNSRDLSPKDRYISNFLNYIETQLKDDISPETREEVMQEALVYIESNVDNLMSN